jgi:alkanesulfonate monooxygenase SsuD/methylene tetrahydromethanopterin reductase-like flavin-dependent oxidoreductase (luciferase family)
VQFAVYLPTVKEFADARLLAELAREAEQTGWDGAFVWDVLAFSLDDEPWPQVDAWVALAAIAAATSRIRIGPIVEALARRRPWKLARETVSVDRLSGGRLVLGVGLGADPDAEFAAFGEDADARVRAEKLDEGLDVLTKLWRGKRVQHRGRHFRVARTTFLPSPRQTPRIPIWVGGTWPNRAPLRRALHWDGFVPMHTDWPDAVLTPADYRAMRRVATGQRGLGSFDVALITTYDGDRPGLTVREVGRYEDAGVTWWLQGGDTLRKIRATIRRGPPATRSRPTARGSRPRPPKR